MNIYKEARTIYDERLLECRGNTYKIFDEIGIKGDISLDYTCYRSLIDSMDMSFVLQFKDDGETILFYLQNDQGINLNWLALKFGVIGRHYFSKDDIERSYYLKALYENGDRIMEAIKLDNPIYFKEREKRMSS